MSIEDVRDRFESMLMKKPNVIGVGIGESGGKPAIQVLVTKKGQYDDVSGAEGIPESLGGFPVTILEVGDVRADVTERRYDEA